VKCPVKQYTKRATVLQRKRDKQQQKRVAPWKMLPSEYLDFANSSCRSLLVVFLCFFWFYSTTELLPRLTTNIPQPDLRFKQLLVSSHEHHLHEDREGRRGQPIQIFTTRQSTRIKCARVNPGRKPLVDNRSHFSK